MKLNPHRRYQTGLSVRDIYPIRRDGTCRCGCGKKVVYPKRMWATKQCQREAIKRFKIIKGDIRVIRRELKKRDRGICAECGRFAHDWEADHIVPVCQGGGACELDGFQTLCYGCHKDKTGSMKR